MPEFVTTRDAKPSDLSAIADIQAATPEASQWNPGDYLHHRCVVAECGGIVSGFLVARETTFGESEILNMAVQSNFRRRGIGRALLASVLQGEVFLEVRESNQVARALYETVGFRMAGRRRQYYSNPDEDAIVMRFHS